MTEPVSEDLAGAKNRPAPVLQPAPGLASLLGQSLAALLRGPAVFAQAAAAETPPLWAMAANILVFAAAGQGAILVLRSAGTTRTGEAVGLALFHAGAAAAALAGSFVFALIVDVIARISDSDADYLRSYQIVSLSSGAAVAGTAAYALPVLWFIPTAWAAFLIGIGIQKLHRARPYRAWTIVGVLAAAALGGQWFGMLQYRAVMEQTRAAGAVMSEMQRFRAELEKALPALQEDGLLPVPPSLPTGQRLDAVSGGQGGEVAQPPIAAPGKNPFLSPEALVLPPGDAAPTDQPAPAFDPRQSQALMNSSMGIIRSMLPMLNNPQLTKNMSPAQAQQFREIVRTIEGLDRNAAQGKTPTDADLMKLLQAFMSLQAQPMTRPAPGAPGPAGGQRKSAPPRPSPTASEGKP
ncbi:MAG: YIP1 family protein [Elusimicrobia bacterium]|nr:YIP1 family protein [Elusimicrobiota bacterium]